MFLLGGLEKKEIKMHKPLDFSKPSEKEENYKRLSKSNRDLLTHFRNKSFHFQRISIQPL